MRKILIIEDDKSLNEGIVYAIEKEGYRVSSAYDIKSAKEKFSEVMPDLILLDVNLPDGEGFEFCEWVKAQGDTNLVFLTARDLEEDALRGYELGAEDYITKPFAVSILLKKIEVIFKRNEKRNKNIYKDDFLCIDIDGAKVIKEGEEQIITPTEFKILRLFLENKGQLLTYTLLLERLWDSDGQFVDKHTLAVNINRLRGKIENEQHKYISNVYGMGYQWLR